MSVPVNQRSESKLEVCVKARDLCVYTLQITANEKIFLPKFQRSITDDINKLAIAIHSTIWTANNIYVRDKSDYEERKRLQSQAIRYCNSLLSLIQIAQKLFHFTYKRMQYWGNKVIEVRNFVAKWKDAEKARYKEFA